MVDLLGSRKLKFNGCLGHREALFAKSQMAHPDNRCGHHNRYFYNGPNRKLPAFLNCSVTITYISPWTKLVRPVSPTRFLNPQ
jgi:hypothetical protein